MENGNPVRFTWRDKKRGTVKVLPRVKDQGPHPTCMPHALPQGTRRIVELDVNELIARVAGYDIFWGLKVLGQTGVTQWPVRRGGHRGTPAYPHPFKIEGTRVLTEIEDVKRYIRTSGGVFASFYVFADFEGCTNMPYEADRSTASEGAHAVVLVGYDEEQRTWTFINSYGKGFGDKGFGSIRYDHIIEYLVPIFVGEQIQPHYQGVHRWNDPPPPLPPLEIPQDQEEEMPSSEDEEEEN